MSILSLCLVCLICIIGLPLVNYIVNMIYPVLVNEEIKEWEREGSLDFEVKY